MSAAPQAPPAPQPLGPAPPNEITVISHCSLFYWWPVWVMGFIMAALTYWDNHRMVVVPANTQVLKNVTGELKSPTAQGEDKKTIEKAQDVLLVPMDSKGNRSRHR